MFVNGTRSISDAMEAAWREYLDAKVRAASTERSLDEILKPSDATSRLKQFETWADAETDTEKKLNDDRRAAWEKFLRLPDEPCNKRTYEIVVVFYHSSNGCSQSDLTNFRTSWRNDF